LIHAEVFGDLLDMAEHLLGEGYKGPGAVVAGVTLETHLRKLCDQVQIPTHDADGKPLKADRLNQELVKGSVYDKGEAKDVVSWLGQRNDGAHGDWHKLNEDRLRLMIDGVRAFIRRQPA